jgi:non-specific serine/threonine protein kinase
MKKPALYPYQREGVDWLVSRGFRGLLADEQGLGKTPTALVALHENQEQLLPAMVVCPTSLVGNWAMEALKWCPKTRIAIIEGESDKIPQDFEGILLVGWSNLEHYTRQIGKWRPNLLIADEAHAVKNESAKRSEAFESLARRIRHVVLLTGTPLVNMHADLWSLVNLIKPGALGEVKDFRALCKDDPEAAQAKISPFVLRRLFGPTVGDTVPEKRREVVVVEEKQLPPTFRKEYNLAANQFDEWLRKTLPKRLSDEYKRRKLDPRRIDATVAREVEHRVRRAMEYEHLVKQGKLRVLVGQAKVPACVSWVTRHMRKREPVVVFGEHQDVFELMERSLQRARVPYVTIYGTNSGNAHEAVAAFQKGRVPVLLGSRAACQGLTLTRSAHLGFLERYWTSKDEEQAESRIWRLTQEKPVTITRFVIPDTMDERMDELVKAKEDMTRDMIGISEATG